MLTSDLHLTASASTEYRWGLFPWLATQIREERAKTLLILGDLTDAKDGHSAVLVNRVVNEIAKLAELCRVVILCGNHDFLQRGHMFFEFLRAIPNVDVITEPQEDMGIDPTLAYYLPYSKEPAKDWAHLRDFSMYRYLFMHQTIKGARASNGQIMEGEALPDILGTAAKVYSGDIHVPQVIWPIEYVGSPYHVHFGDKFKPRVIVLEKSGLAVDLHFKTISRLALKVSSVRELEGLRLNAGDQVKLSIHLDATDRHDWARIRREAMAVLSDQGIDMHGIELVTDAVTKRTMTAKRSEHRDAPADVLLRYAQSEGFSGDTLDAGLELIERNK